MNKTLSGKPAMNSARRDHIHGQLQPMEYEQPSYLSCIIAGILCAVLAFSALVHVLKDGV